jgi:hypothetical protein
MLASSTTSRSPGLRSCRFWLRVRNIAMLYAVPTPSAARTWAAFSAVATPMTLPSVSWRHRSARVPMVRDLPVQAGPISTSTGRPLVKIP